MHEVRFDSRVFELTVIKKAAYRFVDRFAVEFRKDAEDWVCRLSVVGPGESDVQHWIQQFQSEVLDQDLRERIARETEAVRNSILALAFSRTGLQGS